MCDFIGTTFQPLHVLFYFNSFLFKYFNLLSKSVSSATVAASLLLNKFACANLAATFSDFNLLNLLNLIKFRKNLLNS